MTYDLEVEEVLGDSFLKVAASVSLYFNEGNLILDEGTLTRLRSRIVGNRNLFRLALRAGLHHPLRSRRFSARRNWRPPRYWRYAAADALERALCEADNYGAGAARAGRKGAASVFNLLTVKVRGYIIF